MEVTDTIREVLNQVTPQVLKGRTSLTDADEIEITLRLKQQACVKFAIGNLNEAREINSFIESKPTYVVWPKNPVLFMMKRFNNPDAESIIIFPTNDFTGLRELEDAVQKIKNRAVVT